MADRKRKNQETESKKRTPRRAPQNRYYRRSKLSEYSVLKVLRGFADDLTARECAAGMRVSEKTVRGLYTAFRRKLLAAILVHPYQFGGAGFYLFRHGKFSPHGPHILEAVGESEIFRTALKRHRLRPPSEDEAKLFLFEITIRVFCHIALRKSPEHLYDPQTREAAEMMRQIAGWIRENRDTDGFFETYGDLVARFGNVVKGMTALVNMELLHALKTKSAEHHYPGTVLYDDLRRYLLEDPL